jgi:hypothetical protein
MSYVLGLGNEEVPPDCDGGDVMRVPKIGGGYAWGCVRDSTGAPLRLTGRGTTVPVKAPTPAPALGYVLNLLNSGYSLDRSEQLVFVAARDTGTIVQDTSGKWQYVIIGVGVVGLWWLLRS